MPQSSNFMLKRLIESESCSDGPGLIMPAQRSPPTRGRARQFDGKHRSARLIRLHADLAAVHLDDLPHDVQAKAQAFARPPADAARTERLAQMGPDARCYHAAVRDAQLNRLIVAGVDLDDNAAAGLTVMQRVVDQVGDGLPH